MEEKLLEARPPSPCGNDKDHYFWVEEGWACPRCHAVNMNAKKYKDEEAKLDRLADKIVERLKNREVIR
jgi:hypothetical protein